jgi:simple sugar transport system ATP-binding protein
MAKITTDILVMKGISKAFPGVQALENVDFALRSHEIHALVGENGAGKSTLIKLLTGVERPDSGTIVLDGKQIVARSPQHAQALGVSTVFQEVNLCPNLSVAENILIGHEPRAWGRRIDWKTLNARARQMLQRLDIDIDVTRTLDSYPVAIQQMAAIVRALEISSAKVLVLDEPTSSLDAHETNQLFKVMRKIRDEGTGVIFITHFIDQIYEVSDRITVLRNGTLVGTYETQSMPRLELIAKMIGRSLTEYEEMVKTKLESGKNIRSEATVQARGLGRVGSIAPFDLDLHPGEVVGLAGLLGSGRTEIAALLFGTDKPDSGTIFVAGKKVKEFSPLASIKRRVALCPEDRKSQGIVDELTIRENIVLAMQASRGWFRYISIQQQYEIAEKYIRLLNIATPSADQAVGNLSGGNQQKVILARWLATNPQLLILDEPTRGIDIGAKAEIQRLVLSLAEEGKSCVFISSEIEEVMRTSHRIVVLRERKKVSEFAGEVQEQELMQSIAGSES